jgi:CHAT domain-containing protein
VSDKPYASARLSPFQSFLVRLSIRGLVAIIGPALVGITLCGSTWRPQIDSRRSPAAEALSREGILLYKAGRFTAAGRAFQEAAARAEREGSPHNAAMNWSNAGGAELAHLNFRAALPFFLKARTISESSRLAVPYFVATNNLASLYLEMGDPESAVRVAREALGSANLHELSIEDRADHNLGAVPKLEYQLATGLARLHRFHEAEPVYRQAIDGITALGDLQETAHVLGNFGSDCLEAGQLDEADTALREALRLIRMHDLNDAANILRPLAKLRARQGDTLAAAALFDAAIRTPRGITTEWDIYTDRGEFRLRRNDLRGALADFREARRIAAGMRADIVPADRDRITLEGDLSRTTSGLIDAGNRLAQQTSDPALLRETFDAAEQDRNWSLRALIPADDDWRSHLPPAYWDQLARYQAVQRAMVNDSAPALESQAASLQAELQKVEASAANEAQASEVHTIPPVRGESALTHVRRVLDGDSVLLSFHVASSTGWLWAVDHRGVRIYPIPGRETLQLAIRDFARATQDGSAKASDLGRDLYQMLFGSVAAEYLSHRRWLLELDGPLYDLPFAALTVNGEVLFQRAAIQTVPGALMLAPRKPFEDGSFLGIGDAVYNTADPRYHGARAEHAVLLPRLAGASSELRACAREWRGAGVRLLTGADAGIENVRAALAEHPAVIHFATHIVSPGPHASGMIALSLDQSGAMQLMGPVEVAARPGAPGLVVLNGCHSAAGETLPGTGLMGLTRAWIAAGARSVVATRWDIPDDAGAALMVEFYRALRARPGDGPAYALQQAQRKLLREQPAGNPNPSVWGAYFVLGRE